MVLEARRQRILLWSFIASIAICALTGIYCLLLGTWGELQERIVISSATIAATSILALAATIPWSRHVWHPIGPAGVVAAALALAVTLVAIWTESVEGDPLSRATGVSWVLGLGVPVIGLLGLARLRPSFGAVRLATAIAVTLLGLQLIPTIIVEPEDVDWWWRIMGVVAILSASGIIAVPILHRLSGIPYGRDTTDLPDQLVMTCPRCGSEQKLPVGRSACSECRLRFHIEIEQ